MKPSKIKLPKRYNYAEAYLTFKCMLGCSYCINKVGGLKSREEMSPKEWADALNRISFGNVSLTLGGGEPTLYPGFYDLVDMLKMPIDLLTNLQFDVEEFIKKVNPDKFTKPKMPYYHSIRASYHSETMDREDTIKRAKRLINAGFNVGIFGVRHPYNINENMQMAFMCAHAGVPFYEKDFLGKLEGRIYGFYKYPEGLNGELKSIKCRTRELLIDPHGEIYRCHRDLYKGEYPIENIKTIKSIKDVFRPCKNYGACNPCDLKLKTNKYLKGVECQIEIK